MVLEVALIDVRDRSAEAHDAVRQGDGFGQWRALIGPHFAGPPHVEHVTDL